MQGYAYILTHPGVPSVFWDHYFDWGLKSAIDQLIAVRKDNGLHSESSLSIKEARWDLYAAEIDGKVAMKIGPGSWSPSGSGWVLRTSGTDYAVWDKAPAGDLTIHFKPSSWNNPTLYFWNATPSGANTSWPGQAMQAEGNGWYAYTLSNTDCSNFIISNNGYPQSPDLYTCNDVWIYEGNWNFSLSSLPNTDHEINTGIAETATLTLEAYPNPMAQQGTLRIHLPKEGDMEANIFNLAGQQMAQLAAATYPAGRHDLQIDTRQWPAGIYLAKVKFNDQYTSMKLIVLP